MMQISDQLWKFCEPKNMNLPRQGFKLHISAHQKNAKNILEKTKTYLKDKNIYFKYAKNLDVLIDLNAGIYGNSQIGKFITIYPLKEEFKKTAYDLSSLLKGESAPVINSDLQVSSESPVYFRYGVIDVDDEKKDSLETPEGTYIRDKRDRRFAIPSWEKTPIKFIQNYGHENLLNNIIFLKTLRLRGRGGVFLGLLKGRDSVSKIVIKEGRPYGEYFNSEDNGIKRIINESDILKLIQKHDIAPNLIDLRIENEHYLLLTEYKNESSLKELLISQIQVTDEHLLKILKKGLLKLKKLHNLGVFHLDLTPDNILLGENIYFIDFEYSCCKETISDFNPDYFTNGFVLEAKKNNYKLTVDTARRRDIYSLVKSILCISNHQWYEQLLKTNISIEFLMNNNKLQEIYELAAKGKLDYDSVN